MLYLVISLVILGFFAAILEIRTKNKDNEEETVEKRPSASCATCTTPIQQCEQECMMEAAVKEIEYYDDEELDAFAGRASDCYTDEECGQFEEILSTMNPNDVAGWSRSLILRGINLPNQLKDEVIMMINENQ